MEGSRRFERAAKRGRRDPSPEAPPSEKMRCAWASGPDERLRDYHDREWGRPVHDDRRHFEFLILEASQAGLSWAIILRKREGYRKAFGDFEPARVARFTPSRIDHLVRDPGIIRNRRKVEASVQNARHFLQVQEEFGSFDAYCWRFVGGRPRTNRWKFARQVPGTTPEAEAFSRDLRSRGFAFVGPTVMYAHMQAVGMVNDHLVSCFRYAEVREPDGTA